MRISTEQISPLQLFQNPPFAIAVCTAEITFLRLNFLLAFTLVSMRLDLFSTFCVHCLFGTIAITLSCVL